MSALAVVGLTYGDESKGSMVDYLTRVRRALLNVRFNGGCQCGHNVVLPDGRHHCFSQFGSGTFGGASTFLSRYMLVDPLRLATEAEHLISLGIDDVYKRMIVDREALLTTPYHAAMNQARERLRGANKHGTCGMGIGETMAYALDHPLAAPRVGDCQDVDVLADKLFKLVVSAKEEFGDFLGTVPSISELLATYQIFPRAIEVADGGWLTSFLRKNPEGVIFEGAQGVLLDQTHGVAPYHTWSNTTFDNAQALCDIAKVDLERLGVVRSYMTRHGPGPFVTEDPYLRFREPHNQYDKWQGLWRRGHFDAQAVRYAIEVCGGVDSIAISHLDQINKELKFCHSYDAEGKPIYGYPNYAQKPIQSISIATGARVSLTSAGPTFRDKTMRSSSKANDDQHLSRSR